MGEFICGTKKGDSVKISILIPNYGNNPYLETCLDSVSNQITNNEFELEIVFSDQSEDCYAEQNRRLIEEKYKKVIYYKSNTKGLLNNRHDLMKIATGDYIYFVDSDDFIDDNSVLCFYSELRENGFPDMLICSFSRCDEDGNDIPIYNQLETDITESNYRDFFYCTSILNSVSKKVFKRDLYESNDYISNDVVNGEDFVFSAPIIEKANTILLRPNLKKYHYRTTPGSMVNNYSFEVAFASLTMKHDYYRKHDLSKFQKQILLQSQLGLYKEISRTLISKGEIVFKQFKEYSDLLRTTWVDELHLSDTSMLTWKQKMIYLLIRMKMYPILYQLLKK